MLLAAMVGFPLTHDLFNLFVWFEVMSDKLEGSAIAGALNFTVTNSLAGFMMFLKQRTAPRSCDFAVMVHQKAEVVRAKIFSASMSPDANPHGGAEALYERL